MTPYEELVSGDPMGPSMYALLVRLIKRAARRYPPPPGHRGWSDEAARQWLHDYFLPKKGATVAAKFLKTATDDDTLVLVARAAIQHALIDDARATTAGRMAQRLETMLPREGFLSAGAVYAGEKGWTLPELGDQIYHGDWKDLLRDPRLKGIPPIISLPTQGTTSRANIASIVRAVRGLLLAAGGAMVARDVASAVVELFELDVPALYALRDNETATSHDDESGLSVDDDAHQEGDEADSNPTREFADPMQMREDAVRIWTALDDDEKRLIGFLDQPEAIWKQLLPGRSDVKAFARSLKEKLRKLLREEPVIEGTLGTIVAWSVNLPS